MANIFVNILVPAANGSGAAVDMSAFGPTKTMSVVGPFDAAVTLEISNELVPTSWSPLITFNNPDGITQDFACRWMRATVAGYKSGAPACDVGGTDDGTLFANLPVTAGDGAGAAIDVSLLGIFKTVQVGGTYRGNVQIEVSEDGIARWSQIDFGFPNPGQQSQVVAAAYMRVVRQGVPSIAPGMPIVNVGGCTLGGGAVGPPGPPGPPGQAGTSLPNCYIFRPGSGGIGPAVFDSWTALYAQLVADRAAGGGDGCFTIAFDDSIVSPCVVPPGAYNMTGVAWESYQLIASGINVEVSIPEGATFTKLRLFNGTLLILFTGTTPPISDLATSDILVLGGGVRTASFGAGPFVSATVVGQIVLSMDQGSVIGTGATPWLNIGSTTTVLLPMAGVFGELQPNTISGAVGSVLILGTGNPGIAQLSENQPAFLGTINPTNITKWRINPTPQPPSGPYTADQVLTDGNTLALVDPSGIAPTPVVITLPPVVGTQPNRGQIVIVKNVAATGSITVDTQGGDTIDGAASVTTGIPYAAMMFASDGVSDWRQVVSTASVASEIAFTYRPGSGLFGPFVFDDFNALYAAFDAARTAAQVSGKFKIVFDDQSIGGPGNTVVLDSGPGNITYDFLYATLIGVHEDANVLLDIQDGGGETDSLTIINALWFEGLTIRATGQDTAFDTSNDQTFTLTRTTFLGGGGAYVMNFLGVSGCILHLNDESTIERNGVFPAGAAAVLINSGTVLVHMNGANCRVNANAFITGGGGILTPIINSSSARFDFDQADVGGVTSPQMSTAAGYWTTGAPFTSDSPNGSLIATAGTLAMDERTNIVWRNVDGATAWVGDGVERLSADGAASPFLETTFVSGAGTDLTLADGVLDGWVKRFVITAGTGTITPANLADGNVLTWSLIPANVNFIWDATIGTWHVYGNPYNMITT